MSRDISEVANRTFADVVKPFDLPGGHVFLFEVVKSSIEVGQGDKDTEFFNNTYRAVKDLTQDGPLSEEELKHARPVYDRLFVHTQKAVDYTVSNLERILDEDPRGEDVTYGMIAEALIGKVFRATTKEGYQGRAEIDRYLTLPAEYRS